MSKIVLYSHGGSGNHGCEAIVRGTFNVLHGEIDELYSYRPEEDLEFGLDKIIKESEKRTIVEHILNGLISSYHGELSSSNDISNIVDRMLKIAHQGYHLVLNLEQEDNPSSI